jgi:hypothetical protein
MENHLFHMAYTVFLLEQDRRSIHMPTIGELKAAVSFLRQAKVLWLVKRITAALEAATEAESAAWIAYFRTL